MIWTMLILLLLSGDVTKLKKADALYRSQKYEEAYAIYREELDKNPGDFELAFNAGNALYKMGKYEEAEKLFDQAKSLTNSAAKSSAGKYNQSLSNLKKKDLEKALTEMKEAIKQNPSDEDAKANFEVISRLLKKQQQQQQQQKDQKKKDKDDKKDEKQKQQEKNDQDKKDQKDQQKEQPRQSQIPKEQAQRLLDALKKNEKEALLKRKEMSGKVRRQVDKDW